jgi:hypothetical protein
MDRRTFTGSAALAREIGVELPLSLRARGAGRRMTLRGLQ